MAQYQRDIGGSHESDSTYHGSANRLARFCCDPAIGCAGRSIAEGDRGEQHSGPARRSDHYRSTKAAGSPDRGSLSQTVGPSCLDRGTLGVPQKAICLGEGTLDRSATTRRRVCSSEMASSRRRIRFRPWSVAISVERPGRKLVGVRRLAVRLGFSTVLRANV